jgi:hypothetical protein
MGEDPFGPASLVEIVVDERNAQPRILGSPRLRALADQLICDFPRGTIRATVNFCKYALATRKTSSADVASIADNAVCA